jgi:hypothetical protein
MAEITRTNGDVLSGVNQNTAVGALVSFNGSQPLALAIVVKNGSGTAVDIRAEGQAGESIEKILFTVLTKATITYYQIENTTGGQISVMLEANGGGWTASDLQTAIRALGASVGANTIDVTGTTVTNVGLKLALS